MVDFVLLESLAHVIARFKPGDSVTRRCCGALDRPLEADDDPTELVAGCAPNALRSANAVDANALRLANIVGRPLVVAGSVAGLPRVR